MDHENCLPGFLFVVGLPAFPFVVGANAFPDEEPDQLACVRRHRGYVIHEVINRHNLIGVFAGREPYRRLGRVVRSNCNRTSQEQRRDEASHA